MKFPRRQFLRVVAGAAVLPASIPRIASAQAYPSRPITLLVPYPPGGSTDSLARILAERMRASLGVPVIVENVGGAGGSLGTGRVARAEPDGYMLGLGNTSTHVVNGAAYNLNYDVVTDFEPVAFLAETPACLLGRTTFPATDLNSLISWLKQNPGKASVSVVGAADLFQLIAISFQNKIGVDLRFIPYRGGGPALQDLIGGQIDLTFGPGSTYLAAILAGQVKAFAVLAKSRWPAAADVPTVDEGGAAGLYASFWHGLWVPKNTPGEIVQKLNAAVGDALADATVARRLTDLGQEVPTSERQTPSALRKFQETEIEKWWPIIKAANLKPQ